MWGDPLPNPSPNHSPFRLACLDKKKGTSEVPRRSFGKEIASGWVGQTGRKTRINSVQARCIVKGEAQRSPLFRRFSGGF